MQMEEGLDTGPMLLKREVELAVDETGSSLHDRLSPIGAEALMAALPDIEAGTMEPEVQDDALANYARKLDKAESSIDWTRAAVELDRQVRAFNSWPVAQTKLGDDVIRIWQTTPVDQSTTAAPGQVLSSSKQGIDVACGAGVLRILKLQAPGKRAMDVADFVNARDLSGQQFGA
jgi:methionyl-tRNA formyltransferase